MPTENGEMDVHVASQGSSGMHKDISMALNVPMNKINVKVERCGMNSLSSFYVSGI